MKQDLIIESMYFPPASVLQQMAQANNVFIDIAENYRKGTFRNKCLIATGNGPQQLIVPLKQGKNNQMPLSQVEISYDENWPKKHLSAIRTAYGKSPYFIYFMEEIERLIETRFQYLVDLNEATLALFIKYYKLDFKPQIQEIYLKEFEGIDLRNTCKPNNYESFNTKYYPQVFEDKFGFQPNLSCLDLLFCMGNYGREILI